MFQLCACHSDIPQYNSSETFRNVPLLLSHVCLCAVRFDGYIISLIISAILVSFFTSQLAAYCASASVVLVPEHDSDSNSQSSGKQRSGSRMGKYRKVCPLGNHAV